MLANKNISMKLPPSEDERPDPLAKASTKDAFFNRREDNAKSGFSGVPPLNHTNLTLDWCCSSATQKAQLAAAHLGLVPYLVICGVILKFNALHTCIMHVVVPFP